MDTLGTFMKLFKEKAESTCINRFGGHFYSISKNSTNDDELHYAICFYADLLENCSEQSFVQGVDEVAKTVMNFWPKVNDINMEQTCVYTMGVLAKRATKAQFQQFLPTCLQMTINILNHTESYNEERAECTDNAVSALGKICLFQLEMDNQESLAVMDKFLSLMPIHHDPVEAQALNKIFIEQIGAKNKNLVENAAMGPILKNIILKMNEFVRMKPESEILDEEGKGLLNQIQF